jgi:murein DD-endopeptidase MepM/ murein hydrolase activator NlpD
LTIYQFSPDMKFIYYYAHLERYAPDLTEGDEVRRGQTIGFVGTSGNAPPNTPHLQFAIFKALEPPRWWEGVPLDPYDVLR